jgi:hypothetical protein
MLGDDCTARLSFEEDVIARWGPHMKTYDFDVVLQDVAEITDEQADVRPVSGCARSRWM